LHHGSGSKLGAYGAPKPTTTSAASAT